MKKIIVLVLVLCSFFSFSQDKTSPALDKFTRINLGFHGLEVTNELPISKSFVWENSLGIGMGYSTIGSGVSYTLYLDAPTPYITSELKFLYNRNKRFSKGRSTMNNSGNYIGLQTKYSFGNTSTLDINQALLSDIHWGIQRPLGERFIFDFHIGFGYLSDFNLEEGIFTPTLGLRFGYKLF